MILMFILSIRDPPIILIIPLLSTLFTPLTLMIPLLSTPSKPYLDVATVIYPFNTPTLMLPLLSTPLTLLPWCCHCFYSQGCRQWQFQRGSPALCFPRYISVSIHPPTGGGISGWRETRTQWTWTSAGRGFMGGVKGAGGSWTGLRGPGSWARLKRLEGIENTSKRA